MDRLEPKDHGEAVALFRSQIIGALVAEDLLWGELKDELRKLSEKRVRPPGSPRTRTYSVPTLERWYSAEFQVMRSHHLDIGDGRHL